MLIDLARYNDMLPPEGFAPYAEAVSDTLLQFSHPAGSAPPAGIAAAGYPLPPPGFAPIVVLDRAVLNFVHAAADIKAAFLAPPIITWRVKQIS